MIHHSETDRLAPQDAPEDVNGTAPPLPVIHMTTDMTAVVDQAQEALLMLPHAPVIFQRGHILCNIAQGVKPPKWLHRSPEAPIIQPLKPARLMELMSRAATWLKYEKRAKQGEEWQPALPPRWAGETLHARPAWPFQVLEGIIHTPTLRPDGSMLATPGYDVETGLYLETNGTSFPPLPEHPTYDDARDAVAVVKDLLQDFPFVGTGFAAALAALLSLLCRPMVQGNVPLFAVRSTVRGSGKGLLIDTLSTIGTGRPAPHWAQSEYDEEDRKRLLTVGLAGDSCLHIDNVKYPLGSPALDLALTTSSVNDRLLGSNQQVTVQLMMVWFASGNNMVFKGDTARRVVPIDLDPQMERPEERQGFVYARLLAHVRACRPALAMTALTIVQAYLEAGKPPQGLTAYGSFEEWSDLIRSAVVWATDTDPCEGRKDLEAQSDPAFERLASLLNCWEACYGEAAVSVSSALETITKELAREEARERTTNPEDFTPNPETQKWLDLQQALSRFDSTWRGSGKLNAIAIGSALPAIKGRVIGNQRFERSETRYNDGHRWSVASVASVAFLHSAPESVINPLHRMEWGKDTLATQGTLPAPDSERPTGVRGESVSTSGTHENTERASTASASPIPPLDGQAPPSTTGLQTSKGRSRIGSQVSAGSAPACRVSPSGKHHWLASGVCLSCKAVRP